MTTGSSPTVNLLPEAVRNARAARRRLRTWGIIAGSWCAALAALSALLATMHFPNRDALDHEITSLTSERVKLTADIAALDSKVSAQARTIAATRATLDHPDWSALLVRLIEARPKGMVFSRWQLAMASEVLALRLEGICTDVPTLTGFVIGLEQLDVFRRVAMTSAKASEEKGGVQFSIDCVVMEKAKDKSKEKPK